VTPAAPLIITVRAAQNAMAQEGESGAAVHLPLDHFVFVFTPRLCRDSGQGDGRDNGFGVEAGDRWLNRGRPGGRQPRKHDSRKSGYAIAPYLARASIVTQNDSPSPPAARQSRTPRGITGGVTGLKSVDEAEDAVGAVVHHVVAGIPFMGDELRVVAGAFGRSGHR
jgi:hypothetical protein